jgi:trehalose/maltose transport system substrate-binding protein
MSWRRHIAGALLLLPLCACRHAAPPPVTLSYFRLGWSQPDELPTAQSLSQQFSRGTGIELRSLPVPENTLDQMSLSRQLLEQGASGPDALGIDLIWAPVLEKDLLDLRPWLAPEIASLEPALVSSYTVDNKLIALPYQMQVGVLEYRIDLLRQYGYDRPPRTWDELERMAERIQIRERAKGNKDFWGYVWQGADAESLTCNALEWQLDAGGGNIIENNRTISVNNPAAVQAWQRARRWIGWISPPGVVAYQEQDTMNLFDAGNAAFARVWGGATIPVAGKTRLTHVRASSMSSQTGYAGLPGGPVAWTGTLGGSGLAISRHSLHPQQAVELVRFLARAQIQSGTPEWSKQVLEQAGEVDDMPTLQPGNSGSPGRNAIARRPSALAGPAYEQVTRAYSAAVHSVLTRQTGGAEAATRLERQLSEITGFPPGPPTPTHSVPAISPR